MSEILYDQKLCPLYVGNTCSEIDKAYQQGRADAIEEIKNLIDDEYYDGGYGTYHEVEMIVRTLEQLKEQK